MSKLIRLLLVLGLASPVMASTVNVTATITDGDGQTWNNCTWSATLISPNGPPTISGVPVGPTFASGLCSSSGVITVTLTNTSSIDQQNAQWQFSILPNATAKGAWVVQTAVTTSNLSAILSANLPGPRFPAGTAAFGYLNVEVFPTPALGATYYNVSNGCTVSYGTTGWSTCPSGSGATIAHTPLVLKGDNAGNAVAATGQDEALTAALGTSGNVIETTTPPPNAGNNNTIYGFGAGAALTFTPNTATTSAYENVIIGYLAGQHQTTQNFNVLIGSQAGNSLTGSGAPVEDGINTCIGAGACQTLVTGGDNVYLGEDSGSGNAGAGSGNTVLGVHAGDNITTLNSSEIIGHSAMGTTGVGITVSNDVVIGDGAASNASGSNSDNIIEGHQAANNFTTGIQNVYIGSAVAPQVTSGQHNVVVGYDGAPGLTTGSDNTIIGWEAMNSQIASSGSIAIGSLANSDTGSDNVEAGSFSGGSASQSDQVCLGLFSCNNMTGGSNVAVGIQANATGAGTGHNNVLLGRLAQVGPNINSASQIGAGTNPVSSSLQFLNIPIAGAATFTATGCTNSTLVGGATAGSYHSGTTGTCTVVITTGLTAPNGWACFANDLTTTSDTIKQTASSTTTATLAGTTVTGDVINFGCHAY